MHVVLYMAGFVSAAKALKNKPCCPPDRRPNLAVSTSLTSNGFLTHHPVPRLALEKEVKAKYLRTRVWTCWGKQPNCLVHPTSKITLLWPKGPKWTCKKMIPHPDLLSKEIRSLMVPFYNLTHFIKSFVAEISTVEVPFGCCIPVHSYPHGCVHTPIHPTNFRVFRGEIEWTSFFSWRNPMKLLNYLYKSALFSALSKKYPCCCFISSRSNTRIRFSLDLCNSLHMFLGKKR